MANKSLIHSPGSAAGDYINLPVDNDPTTGRQWDTTGRETSPDNTKHDWPVENRQATTQQNAINAMRRARGKLADDDHNIYPNSAIRLGGHFKP